MSYDESVHTRLSQQQKELLIDLSNQHRLSVSTVLRGMIEHCLVTPGVMDLIADSDVKNDNEEVDTDGIVQPE